MPFEAAPHPFRRIAVIGGGISGLGAAHLLARRHRVTLYEAEPRLGGHARTVLAGRRGDQPVDTGFIVFNRVNYPRLTRLFEELDVPLAPSRMSFGVSIGGGRLEYGLDGAGAIFAQRRRAADPRFLRMLRDILRFNRLGLGLARAEAGLTVGTLLERLGTGTWFRDYYLTPFSGAIWSTPRERMLDFPAGAMLEFFRNHALLGYGGQHQWHTVRGGSAEYVRRLEARLRRQGVAVRAGSPVAAVTRGPEGVSVAVPGAPPEVFDEVVMAVHTDVALRLLTDARAEEKAALSAIGYQPNEVVLHADPALMPRRRAAWSSWVYTEPPEGPGPRIGITYWMNSLQPIPQDDPLFVTLNPSRPIRDDLVYDRTVLHHPVYDLRALAAQARLRALGGTARTWFCGAWMGHGFHEDGLASAAAVAEAMGRRSGALAAA